MQLTLYVASKNTGKLRDFATAARFAYAAILPLPGLDEVAAPPEDGTTFAANAAFKAAYYSRALPAAIVLADDSGLEVDALGGAPGVHSARYAADAGFDRLPGLSPDDRNNLLLLDRLAGVPEDRRAARYRCCLAAAQGGRILLETDGIVEGRILSQPRGHGGFGYDPLFYLPDLRQTMAEIDLETKDGLSHRGNALRSLLRHRELLLREAVEEPKRKKENTECDNR